MLCDVRAAFAIIPCDAAQAQTEHDGIVDLLGLDTFVVDKYLRIRCAEAVYDDIFSVRIILETAACCAAAERITMEQLKECYDAEFEVAVMKSVLTSKVMRLIRDAADITVI